MEREYFLPWVEWEPLQEKLAGRERDAHLRKREMPIPWRQKTPNWTEEHTGQVSA